MPYEYITHENGFTEIIAVNLTPLEEIEQMKRMNGVKLFPSANHRSTSSSLDQEPLELDQPKQHQRPKQQ
jgi:hypothetical protein